MAKTVRDTKLGSRPDRAKLDPREEPYWRLLAEGSHLGYHRGARTGKWVARYRQPGSGKGYIKARIGEADDVRDADGTHVLSFSQAQERAHAWFKQQAAGGKAEAVLTVRAAVEAYTISRNARTKAQGEQARKSSAHYTLARTVLADTTLANKKLGDLREADLRSWQRRLGNIAASTKRRIVNDFKAALNASFEEHRTALPADLPVTIKFGLKAVFADDDTDLSPARDNQILNDDQIRRILEECGKLDPDGDRFPLVLLLAATGARFSQVKRMQCDDVQPALKRVRVPRSRKGKGKDKGGAHVAVRVGDDVLLALGRVIAGRSGSEPLLERWRHRQVSPTEWVRVERGPWSSASEMTRWWSEVVAAAGLPSVIPYALRHSSIVRAISSGLPIRLVAALHDTSVAMIERHYSRWIAESLDELAAQAIVPLVADGQTPGPRAEDGQRAADQKKEVMRAPVRTKPKQAKRETESDLQVKLFA